MRANITPETLAALITAVEVALRDPEPGSVSNEEARLLGNFQTLADQALTYVAHHPGSQAELDLG